MTSHSETLEATIKRYRKDVTINDDDFRLMLLGAALIDGIFAGNQEHSIRVGPDLYLPGDLPTVSPDIGRMHDWKPIGEEIGSMTCSRCGVVFSNCGATSESWLCPE